jgi:hypothetical protein
MLTMQIPMLLALLGTALMAIVIFAPSRSLAPVSISLSPPPAPPAVERWDAAATMAWETAERDSATAAWPTLIDPRAADCDRAARLLLVEALATVRTAWSETILQRAVEDEPDQAVRDAVIAALR